MFITNRFRPLCAAAFLLLLSGVTLSQTPAPQGAEGVRAWYTKYEYRVPMRDGVRLYQDARGRYMSEGEFQQVRPHVPDKRRPKDVDESTDTYDTIEWLLKNVPNLVTVLVEQGSLRPYQPAR